MTALNNAYFAYSDPVVRQVGDELLHPTWWSRPYEYAFALQFADTRDTAADMGCGWMGRPLTAELARRSKEVYAIDADDRVTQLENSLPNLYYLPMDFTSSDMDYFKASTFDKVYCISVIEDLLPGDRQAALKSFRRLVKPDGKIILTVDAIWEPFRIAEPYPTVNINHLIQEIKEAGLRFVGAIDWVMPQSPVCHPKWNLACWHCVLERA